MVNKDVITRFLIFRSQSFAIVSCVINIHALALAVVALGFLGVGSFGRFISVNRSTDSVLTQ